MKKLITLFMVCTQLFAIENRVRLVTYNLENYGGDGYNNKTETSRNPHYRTIINAIDPDILVVQEIYGAFDGDSRFLNDVLNHENNIYASAFIDQKNDANGNDVWHDIGVYFKNQMFQPLSIREVEMSEGYLRDALEVKLKYNETGDTIIVYGLHFKAGESEAAERQQEARKLRNYLNTLPENTTFVVCGDFNIYTSSEEAWKRLTEEQQDDDGRVFDPVEQVGNWHNNSYYKAIHTQSTRYESGGLDDRFDFILISGGIKEHHKIEYIPGTYTAFGNDGNHFNDSVNWQTNNSVSSEIADALYAAADHLPVYADFDFTGTVGVVEEITQPDNFVLEQNYPNPFNPRTTIAFQVPFPSHIKLAVYDLMGNEITTILNREMGPGRYHQVWDGTDNNHRRAASGIYFLLFQSSSGAKISQKMVLVK
ncbi:MAG: endonuclease/exonuclease/phosphatase family protein [Candidatus Marinimicrobia bacterium]|nr:endonuclease/exonuclease/phosphatase family protein [Candidatus Neomarinimicrobiota bacterium]